MPTTSTFYEVCRKIDWDALQVQKQTLLYLMEVVAPESLEDLEGLVNLIDALQDSAVDHYHLWTFSQD